MYILPIIFSFFLCEFLSYSYILVTVNNTSVRISVQITVHGIFQIPSSV